MAHGTSTKSGKAKDAYAVVYYKVVDHQLSAYYVDAETNKVDSERAAAKYARKLLVKEVAAHDSFDQKTFSEKLLAALKTKEKEFGLEYTAVELRGVWDVEENVPDKIRAMEIPHPDFDAPGHDLPNDYWADQLTPAFFDKMTYGSAKVPRTPAAVSLEWSIPSPPDFHHFNEIPKLCVAPSTSDAPKVAGH